MRKPGMAFKDKEASVLEPLGVRDGSRTSRSPSCSSTPQPQDVATRCGQGLEGGSSPPRCLEQGMQKMLVWEGESMACDHRNG